jgi:general secretion pathway protein G
MDTNTEMVAQKKDRGFTLVELLIVIVILGILATVTVFAVRGITDKGQENSCKVERRSIETAVESFFADTGGDVTGMGDLVGDYLKTDPSARWSIGAAGADGSPTVVAVAGGDCVGF